MITVALDGEGTTGADPQPDTAAATATAAMTTVHTPGQDGRAMGGRKALMQD